MSNSPDFDVVIPSVGRPSLASLLTALSNGTGPTPAQVVVVLDRGAPPDPLPSTPFPLRFVPGAAAGPAAARNTGWRVASAPWIAFLDDDVEPDRHWRSDLAADLADLPPDVAGSQGRVRVPVPGHRRPTDWERNVAGLEQARWITADMAYRRSVLAEVGGFDERFRRAYREDADLALRVERAGHRLVVGRRTVAHPPIPAPWWISLKLQAGNGDDVLMRRLHGRRWREQAGAPAGRFRRHAAVTTAAGLALAGLATRRQRVAALAAATWVAGTAELAWARIAPGPRTVPEVGAMVATSVGLPAAAVSHRLAGEVRWREVQPPGAPTDTEPLDAVLFDRDGTLVRDVPYNGDPDRVEPMPGAREALDRLRQAGMAVAVVSNQSGVSRGLLTAADVEAVNRRVEELLGPIGTWVVCHHGPDDGCGCRKPAPGMVKEAASRLGTDPTRCAVVGDIGADMDAARAAGARAVLVPTPVTRPEEVADAPEVAPTLLAAVDLLLGSTSGDPR